MRFRLWKKDREKLLILFLGCLSPYQSAFDWVCFIVKDDDLVVLFSSLFS